MIYVKVSEEPIDRVEFVAQKPFTWLDPKEEEDCHINDGCDDDDENGDVDDDDAVALFTVSSNHDASLLNGNNNEENGEEASN